MHDNLAVNLENQNSTNTKKLLLISTATIGSILEYFDFMVFIFFTPIISRLFFPFSQQRYGILYTYIIVSISYIFRPIGGVFLGYLGDKYGRKTIFYVTLILMGLPSVLIGCLPTFQSIGYFSSFIMILSRILQGIALGGEVPVSITYISERFKSNNYFFYLSWLTFGANIGVALGAQTFNIINLFFNQNAIYEYAWRFPFLFGSIVAVIGFVIRFNSVESEEFTMIAKNKIIQKIPIALIWKNFRPQVLSGIILCTIVSLITSIFIVFLPSLLSVTLSIHLATGYNLSIFGSIIVALCSVFFGYITKYISPIWLIRISMFGLMSSLFMILLLSGYGYNPYFIVCILAFFVSGVNGTFFGILAYIFPTEVRFSGIALCYNIAYLISGLTPLWIGYLTILNDSTKNSSMIMLVIFFIIVSSFKVNSNFYKK